MTKLSYRLLPFSKRLFLSVVTLFLAFAVCFMLFQYQREKSYKSELLNTQLQNYNAQLYDFINENENFSIDTLQHYVTTHMIPNLRVTLITAEGEVLYDNTQKDISLFKNHSSRKEVQDALMYGSGYSISRYSESLNGEEFFYSAHYYPSQQLIIRSALPYNVSLSEHLRADSGFVWFTIIISLILMTLFYRFTHKLGTSITQLQQFALKADRNEPIDLDILETFPKNELGEISQHIIKIYKRLHRAKEALYIEREKLISHLQTSHEGLGVFTRERNEILVNNLFTQYANTISDHNLASTEEVFSIPELAPITDFLNRNEGNFHKEEKRFSLHIDKNARSFSVECIIFQDHAFEISIIDITQEEEQARLKRQLTQNIAHELKTPVSSIQGYLETILNNPNISPEIMHTFLERSYAQSNRLTILLRDISVLTRMDEAPHLVEIETVDLSKIIENMLNEVALNLEQTTIQLETGRKQFTDLFYFPQSDGQCHRLCRNRSNSYNQLLPRRREILLLQFFRYRSRSAGRTPEPSIRTFLPRRQRTLTKTGRNWSGTCHCKERCSFPRRNNLRQEQSSRRIGICLYPAKEQRKLI